MGHQLQNLLNPNVGNSVVAPDATYASLNAELNQSTPWSENHPRFVNRPLLVAPSLLISH